MTVMNSYLLQSEILKPIEHATKPVRGYYIYGAITLRIGSTELLTCDDVDLIDQLWSYFVDSLPAIVSGARVEFYYPDCPKKCEFAPCVDSDSLLITVLSGTSKQSATANRCLFVKEVMTKSQMFYTHLSRIAGGKNTEVCKVMLAKIDAMKF
jgi:hypothetical protein